MWWFDVLKLEPFKQILLIISLQCLDVKIFEISKLVIALRSDWIPTGCHNWSLRIFINSMIKFKVGLVALDTMKLSYNFANTCALITLSLYVLAPVQDSTPGFPWCAWSAGDSHGDESHLSGGVIPWSGNEKNSMHSSISFSFLQHIIGTYYKLNRSERTTTLDKMTDKWHILNPRLKQVENLSTELSVTRW